MSSRGVPDGIVVQARTLGRVPSHPGHGASKVTVMSVSMWREVRWLDHTGSTNSDVAEEARRGGAEGLAVATLEQR